MSDTIVYTTSECPNCEMVKKLLATKDIQFQTMDLGDPDVLSELNLKKIFPMMAPVVYHKGQYYTNVDTFLGVV